MDLRPATWADRHLLYQWRLADEESARWWEGNPVTVEAHNTWLRARLGSPAVRLWVAEHNGEPMGQARIDSSGELSYSIIPDFQGRKLGSELTQKAVSLSPYPKLKAAVDVANRKGVSCLQRAGFELRPDVDFYLWQDK